MRSRAARTWTSPPKWDASITSWSLIGYATMPATHLNFPAGNPNSEEHMPCEIDTSKQQWVSKLFPPQEDNVIASPIYSHYFWVLLELCGKGLHFPDEVSRASRLCSTAWAIRKPASVITATILLSTCSAWVGGSSTQVVNVGEHQCLCSFTVLHLIRPNSWSREKPYRLMKG